MKTIIVVCFFALAAVAYARPNEHYTDKYDKVNVDEILANDQVLRPYVKCLLDKGKCAPDAKELKAHIGDALQTKCSKCTEPQKEGTRKVIKHLINEKPEDWKELSAKFDPDNKYTHEYEKELKEVRV